MEDLRKLVSDLYLFRDHYFESHDLSAAKDKSVKVQKNLSKCLEDMDKLLQQDSESGLASAISADSVLKAESLYLRGRALNITTEHCPEAEKVTTKLTKFPNQDNKSESMNHSL